MDHGVDWSTFLFFHSLILFRHHYSLVMRFLSLSLVNNDPDAGYLSTAEAKTPKSYRHHHIKSSKN